MNPYRYRDKSVPLGTRLYELLKDKDFDPEGDQTLMQLLLEAGLPPEFDSAGPDVFCGLKAAHHSLTRKFVSASDANRIATLCNVITALAVNNCHPSERHLLDTYERRPTVVNAKNEFST